MTATIIVIIGVVAVLVLIAVGLCRVSGRVSREEERAEAKSRFHRQAAKFNLDYPVFHEDTVPFEDSFRHGEHRQ